jgi:hypothetical protein
VFTEGSGWEYVISHLQAGIAIETVILRYPPGKRAFVIKPPGVVPRRPLIYVKLQLGSGVVYGRSFHDSNPAHDDEES